MASLEVMSTRLFPKNQGADGYRLSGVAARRDWVVLSDTQAPRAVLLKRMGPQAPRHVYLSLRAPFDALAFFFREVLPQIDGPFVLVSGSEDVTVPRQLDLRWRPFNDEERGRIRELLDDPRLVRWFAENLDDATHPKFSPLPLGLVFPEPAHSGIIEVPSAAPMAQRPLRVLCAHRVHEGPQWELRREVTRLCKQHFSEFCTVVDGEVSEAGFVQLLREHAFVICAGGGGLDPSPKAWLALLHGAVPIIHSTALDAAYATLPVAIVDAWNDTALSVPRLAQWRAQFSAQLPQCVQRLGLDHWWSLIRSSIELADRVDAPLALSEQQA